MLMLRKVERYAATPRPQNSGIRPASAEAGHRGDPLTTPMPQDQSSAHSPAGDRRAGHNLKNRADLAVHLLTAHRRTSAG